MRLRAYRSDDAAELTRLYADAVEAIGPRGYNPAQVRAWRTLAPSPARLEAEMRDGRVRLVAVDAADRPVAFADLEADGRVAYLYCRPEHAGTGVVVRLHAELERRARAVGITRLYAEASEAAVRFFRRQGYAETGRRDFAVAGVPIHNHAVEKRLAASDQSSVVPSASRSRAGS